MGTKPELANVLDPRWFEIHPATRLRTENVKEQVKSDSVQVLAHVTGSESSTSHLGAGETDHLRNKVKDSG